MVKKPEPKPLQVQEVLSDADSVLGGEYWLKWAIDRAHEGNRNQTGLDLACQLRDSGMSKSEAESFMLQYQRTVDGGSHPYTEREALASLDQAYSTERREPATRSTTPTDAPIPKQDEAQEKESKIKLFTAADALAPLPPIDWVIQNLIPESTVTVMFGDAGSKKTYAAIDAAVCIALGKPWLEFETAQAPALFVDEEMGHRYLAVRLSESLRGHLADENTPIFYTSLVGFNLRKLEDTTDLYELILETKARFVVIDAMMDVIPGADENSVKDVAPVIKALKHIADVTKAAIVLIHHANKAGGYRGSTAIKGGVDLMLEVKSNHGSEIVKFETEKPRLITNKVFAARAVWMDGEFYLVTSDVAAEGMKYLGKAQEYVIRYLAGAGPSEINDIMSHADTTSEQGARQAVYALANMQMVERTNPGAKGVGAIYGLTEKGREWAKGAGIDITHIPV
jgi:hypothetical protein